MHIRIAWKLKETCTLSRDLESEHIGSINTYTNRERDNMRKCYHTPEVVLEVIPRKIILQSSDKWRDQKLHTVSRELTWGPGALTRVGSGWVDVAQVSNFGSSMKDTSS